MDGLDLFLRGWPIVLGIITLIIVLAKLDLRVAVIEEKIKTLFSLYNKRSDEK